jgi:predicted nucleotidyltransferase
MNAVVQEKRAEIEALCREHAVERLFLIGSATGAEFDATKSDVDFLVVFRAQARSGYDDVFFRLLEKLEALFGRPVDLIEARTLKNPYMIASVNRTKQLLYAA